MHCLAWLADSFLGEDLQAGKLGWENCERAEKRHRIKISNRRATQRYNVSAFFYAKICSSDWPEGGAASQYSVFIGQKMSLTG
jgi:hypothetical protein